MAIPREVMEDYEEADDYYGGGGKQNSKRSRSNFIDDYADEDDCRVGAGGRGRKRRRKAASRFFDEEAAVDSDDEEEEEEGDYGFIDTGGDIPDEAERGSHVEEIERIIQQRYGKSLDVEYGEEATELGQQALLPSVLDTKLWMVKCATGHEREVEVRLMHKCIDQGSELQIRSAVALDHLKNYIYIEADREAHVREAIKGMPNIYPSRITLVKR